MSVCHSLGTGECFAKSWVHLEMNAIQYCVHVQICNLCCAYFGIVAAKLLVGISVRRCV